MNNIKIKYISAKNFLCFGPDGIEINFDHYGNIVLVRGDNLDIDPDNEEERRASNGVGKSSIPEIIVYALFGHTIKNLKKDEVINNQIGKRLTVEIIVDNFRIVRTREPATLRVWESDEGVWNKTTEKTAGTMSDTQKWIDGRIGLNFQTFLNLVVFTDNNTGCFLECNAGNKRQIVENLLSLNIYADYHEIAKKHRNLAKETVKNMGYQLDLLLAEKESSKKRIKSVESEEQNWRISKDNELKATLAKYKAKELELKNTDVGTALAAYQEAQEKIVELNNQLPEKRKNWLLSKNLWRKPVQNRKELSLIEINWNYRFDKLN